LITLKLSNGLSKVADFISSTYVQAPSAKNETQWRFGMSWQDIMRRVLSPTGGIEPHITSRYGEVEGRPPGSTKPHRGVDFNYDVPGQNGINLANPALRSPVTGIVTQAGEGKYGTIAIRDPNGFSHELLHSHSRYVTVGDPVVAGQLIGRMGNTGVTNDPRKGNHVHYQLKDSSGTIIDPSAFWDQQGPADPNPAPPVYLGEYQQYLRGLGDKADDGGAVG
jgi:murein DD-endopeptidase MepM/ murein hydrolase activator NlpD